jgi:membrane associated rhomboid family serine protease
MRSPPPLTDLPRYPTTVGVGLMALAATVAWHSGRDISPLFMDHRVWHGEPWRLVTSALPHVDVLHLLFNLYWLWVFGSVVEATYGHLRAAALYLFLAAGSAAAEFAVFDVGVGLSGVGYGLFGLLWVLSREDDRFHDVVDARTVGFFIGWFFFCIFTTVMGVLPVANVAHGMGAIQGVLLGFALAGKRGQRLAAACLVGLMVVVFVASTVGRPFVNLSGRVGEELAYAGYLELEAGRDEDGAALYERAVRVDGRRADWWYNLGIAYQRLGRERPAVEAYRQASNLEPRSALYQKTLTEWIGALAYRKEVSGEHDEAAGLYREALDLDERNAANWFKLGVACEKLGRLEAATRAYEKAVAFAPDETRFRTALEASRKQSR